MNFNRFILLIILPVYFFSCTPQQKIPNYLENLNDSTGKGTVNITELRVQKNDILSINVYSISTDPRSDAPYNLPVTGASAGFLVDNSGDIQYPQLGTIHVEGLTKQEIASEIKKRLTVPVELLKDPTVIIRFLNFKVTVLGQVGHEGLVTVPGERLTILEAIGLAGGITDYGKKNTVKIVREIDGQRETGILDLSSKEVFDSPYYNLVQNDLIIIEPTNQRMKDSEQARVSQKIAFSFTIVTVAATLARLFIK